MNVSVSDPTGDVCKDGIDPRANGWSNNRTSSVSVPCRHERASEQAPNLTPVGKDSCPT